MADYGENLACFVTLRGEAVRFAETLGVDMSGLKDASAAAKAVSTDLAARFPPPGQLDPVNELGTALPERAGRGLFGNSEVWVTESPSRTATAMLRQRAEPVPASALWPGVEPS